MAALSINMTMSGADHVTKMSDAELELLRCGNPAARALPLLAAIGRRQPDTITLDYLDDNNIRIQVTPCV